MSKHRFIIPAASSITLSGGGNTLLISAFSASPGEPGASAYQVALNNGFTGTEADFALSVSARYTLITTAKTAIADNRLLLPSAPAGDLLFGKMLVFGDAEVLTEYDGVTVIIDNELAYAQLNEPTAVTGLGVVSYLAAS